MLGLMVMEMESFRELKQRSGYGVSLQTVFMEARCVFRVLEEEGWREAEVLGISSAVQRRKKEVRVFTDEAIDRFEEEEEGEEDEGEEEERARVGHHREDLKGRKKGEL